MWKTEQEKFWAGSFGSDYCKRNACKSLVSSNLSLFAAILSRCSRVGSVLELGANIGMNQIALRQLLSEATLAAVEINSDAAAELGELGIMDEIFNTSLLGFAPGRTYDFVFTKGVLIHLAPEALAEAYRVLYEASSRYVMVAEYYNPTPVTVPYRGHEQRLFKRDFAGELMDAYPDLELVDYGFVYKRDPMFSEDDITWFLMRKQG